MSKKQGKYKNVPDDLLEEYQEIFDSYDVNGNGVIDKKEMEAVLQKLGQPATSKQIQKVFDELGSTNEQITFDEFIEFIKKYHLSKNKNSTDEIIGAFQVFDKNHNGVLSLSEFKHILMDLGQKFTEEEVNEIFNESDLNKDGNLDYKEFVEFWQEQ